MANASGRRPFELLVNYLNYSSHYLPSKNQRFKQKKNKKINLAILDPGWSGFLLINHFPQIVPISSSESLHFDKGEVDRTSTACYKIYFKKNVVFYKNMIQFQPKKIPDLIYPNFDQWEVKFSGLNLASYLKVCRLLQNQLYKIRYESLHRENIPNHTNNTIYKWCGISLIFYCFNYL